MVIVHILVTVMAGGVGAMARSLILEQYRAGDKPIVLAQQDDRISFEKWCLENKIDIPFYEIEEKRKKYMTIFGGLSIQKEKQINKAFEGEDIVFHFHNPIACGLLFKYKGKSICTIHGFVGKISDSKISNFIVHCTVRRILKKKVTVVGCSNAVSRYCNDVFGTSKVLSVLNGLEKIEKGDDNQYIIENGKWHIGYAATIDDLKGWRILAEAYKKLPLLLQKKCDLYFAGEVSPRDKLDFDEFIVNENVHFLGYVKDSGKNFIPFLDVFVLPSRSEGLPMSILESMQAGVIPIATRVGGIPELIEDGSSGFLIDRNSEELTIVLKKILEDNSLLVQVKNNSKKRFEKIGTAKRMERNYHEIYECL